MIVIENLEFCGVQYFPSDFTSKNGVGGSPAHFTTRDGGVHRRNGFGNETVFWPPQYILYAKSKDGTVMQTDLFKSIFFLLGKLEYKQRLQVAENIILAIKTYGIILAVHNEGSVNFWIEESQFSELVYLGESLQNYGPFEDPFEDQLTYLI